MQSFDVVKHIDEYLKKSLHLPFFVSVECDSDYIDLCSSKLFGLHIIKVSDYCTDDSQPDYDRLFDDLKHMSGSVLLLGMGEAVQFFRNNRPIQSIKDTTFPCKIVVLCRGISSLLDEFCANEPKFAKQRCCSVQGSYDCTVIAVSNSFTFEQAVRGYKALLQALESGYHNGKIYVQTNLPIKTAYIIENAYSAIKELIPSFSVPHDALSDKQWQEFLIDNKVNGFPFEHWRTYLSFMMDLPTNEYLKAVTVHSANYSEYQYNLLNYILEVPHTALEFYKLYLQRKKLLKDYDKDKISAYIAQSREKGSDRVYYLTDNTPEERYEIIMAISESHSVPENLEYIFPDLAYYLYDYVFSDDLPEELTEYFTKYKHQKLFNKMEIEFLEQVEQLSRNGNRIYNYLRAKDSIIEKYDDGNTKLVWIDALGVEYLGFIQKVAVEIGLSLKIQIGRSVLPTLTEFNSDFYYKSWNGKKTEKIKALDDMKHEGINYCDLRPQDVPVYLSDELAVIREALKKIKSMLLQTDTSILLASDHGASRLVILHNHKNKWVMKDTGKHGGRCCPLSDIDVKPDYASRETAPNGEEFWVLANYDRFQGGRETGVELHGGATLEEVVVPIIKIKLADTVNRPKIKNETDNPQYTYNTDPVIVLFCPNPVINLRIKMEGKMYTAERQNDNRYRVVLKDCAKRERNTLIECFDGDDFLTSFEVLISSKAIKKDTYTDDFFS